MRNFILAIILLACACDAFAQPTGSVSISIAVSLPQAIARAFKNNKNIQRQQREVNAARARIQEARSQFLPKLNLNGGYTHNGTVLPIAITNSKKDIGVFTGYKNDNQAGLQLTQVIYNGGANMAGYAQSKLNLAIAQETLRAQQVDVAFDATRLYYGVLLGMETLRIAKELYKNAQDHYQDVGRKYAQGTVSRFDLLQSKIRASLLLPEVIKAANTVESLMAEFKKLLGLPMSANLVLTDKSLTYTLTDIQEEVFLRQAYQNRPEMVLQSLGVDLNQWSIALAKSSGRPQVSAGLDYYYRSNDLGDMFNSRHNNWQASLSVSVPIFDGLFARAKVEEAKARYEQANLAKQDEAEQTAVDIRQDCLDLKEQAAIIDSQKDNVEQAREALRIANVSYDNGRATNLDVLDAQVSLSQVQKNLSEAIYDYLMAQASLVRTMGKNLGEAQ